MISHPAAAGTAFTLLVPHSVTSRPIYWRYKDILAMRFIVVFCIFMTQTGCYSSKNDVVEITPTMEGIKLALTLNAFQKSGKTSLNIIDSCVIEIKSDWLPEISELKGYVSVSTTTTIDFKDNFKNTAFVSAHIKSEDGVNYQSWGDLIEINLLNDVKVRKMSVARAGENELITTYDTNYVSIGVLEPDNYNHISGLLKAIIAVADGCSSL